MKGLDRLEPDPSPKPASDVHETSPKAVPLKCTYRCSCTCCLRWGTLRLRHSSPVLVNTLAPTPALVPTAQKITARSTPATALVPAAEGGAPCVKGVAALFARATFLYLLLQNSPLKNACATLLHLMPVPWGSLY